MQIVIDVRTVTNHFPGIGRYVANLVTALAEISELKIYLLTGNPVNPPHLPLPALPQISCSVSPFSISQQWILPGKLWKTRATLYHSPYYLMPYFTHLPTVLTCHDLIPLIYPQYFTAGQRLIFRLTHILALRVARKIITVSQATRADLLHYFSVDPERIVVIPEAPASKFFPQSPDKIMQLRKRYALPENYLLYVGSNKPHKNIVTLIRAFALTKIDIQNPALKLVIAGYWDKRYPEAQYLTKSLLLKDQVVFLGSIEDNDLPALYSGASLFIFPSLAEGFGLPVLEAMACGVPVICSNTSSLPEVAGDAALFVDPLDVKALSEKIKQILKDERLREEMRRKGFLQVNKYSWERVARQTMEVYKGVASE